MSLHLPDQRGLLSPEEGDVSERPATIELTIPHGFDPLDMPSTMSMNQEYPQASSPVSTLAPSVSVRSAQVLGMSHRRSISIEQEALGGNNLSPQTASGPFPSPSRGIPSSPTTPGLSKPSVSPTVSDIYDGTQYGSATEQDERDTMGTAHTQTFADGLDRAFSQIKEPSMEDLRLGDQHSEDQHMESFQMGSDIPNENNYNYNDQKNLIDSCPSRHDIHRHRTSWVSISILILSIYSTIFSGMWFIVAIAQPRYGRFIHSGGSFTPSTASIVFALFAKTIELSFVTVFVAFLGQVLSRRSLIQDSRGVTIAELSMRQWVMQPGWMLAHADHLKHAGATFLGAISLVAALTAMLYTTASDALVSPHLKFGHWENREMQGLVKASYANPNFIQENCQTPISVSVDPYYAGTTCLSVEHAGQAYHSSIAFLNTWAQINAGGEGVSGDLAKRPPPPAMLYDNTTVVGSWVSTNTSNMTTAYQKYNRVINNITTSMPHAGIYAAARESRNGILQPEELQGVGEYAIKASVVSPSLNVLCVNMNETELAPLIYVTWPYATVENSTTIPGRKMAWAGYQNEVQLEAGKNYLNSTVFDDIFEWGANYSRQPPIFPMYPIDFNSITNISVPESDSIYLLLKSASTTDYTMCQMRSFLSPTCSTFYNVSGLSSGHLETTCDDPSDKLRYDKSVSPAPISRNLDWRNVGSEWMLALSLNTGISDANSSTSRLLSQLVPTLPSSGTVKLDSLTPSIAEALAVMAGNTLLMSTMDAGFYHYWQYTSTELDPGTWQSFNASITSQQYTSGVNQKWQGIFYIVLFLVFAANVFCLTYYIVRSGLVTDYTEPQNLFALAVNSPPSERLSGSCGAGPEGEQLNVDWHVTHEDESGHFFIKEGAWAGDEKGRGGMDGIGQEEGFELRRRGTGGSRARESYRMLSTRGRTWL